MRNLDLISVSFKTLKRNLKIRAFVGASAKAVMSQIWTAWPSKQWLHYLQQSSRLGWRFASLVALLRMNLSTHRDLMTWLDGPFAAPPARETSPGRSGLRLPPDS